MTDDDNAAARERSRAWRAQKRAFGLCSCGNPPRPNMRSCADCAARAHATKAERAATGCCPGCGQVRGEASCTACVAKIKTARRKRKLARLRAGLCVYCGQRKPSGTYAGCEPCLVRLADKARAARARAA